MFPKTCKFLQKCGHNGQVVGESDSQSKIVGSILTKVRLATKSEESRQLSVIPGKRQKGSHDGVTLRGRTGVALLR